VRTIAASVRERIFTDVMGYDKLGINFLNQNNNILKVLKVLKTIALQ
jgi:hypothetical protein